MRKINALTKATILIVAGLIIGLVISSQLGIENNGYSKTEATDTQVEQVKEVSKETLDILSAYSKAMVEMVQSVTPSVVNISTTQTITRKGQGPGGLFNDPFFRRFFGDDFSRQFGGPREEHRSGLGSGVIVDGGGYILTNNHVVKDADTIKVILRDKREFEGEVLGTDPKTDLAVIRIKEKNLPAIRWGDSDKLRVGETVVAVGSPYGLNQTVTQGIVSAKGRANVNIADYEDFIQTDAAINPGNSGGPLINIRGELVGINTAIFSTSGGYQGIGFAIPSNMVKVIMDSLIKYQKVVRGWLGVSIQTVGKELAEQFKLKAESGALVSDVMDDSPADKGGLKRGDIIVEFEGKEIKDSLSLRNTVASTAPGTKATVVIIRDGKKKTLNIKIGELPGEAAAKSGDYDNSLAGVSVQDLTAELRGKLGISKRIKGVLVADPGDDTALKKGDVILEVNRTAVESTETYHRVVSSIAKGESILLLVYRDGRIFYMTNSGE